MIKLPNDPFEVTRKVKELKNKRQFKEAKELLEEAFKKWPNNVFIGTQLINALKKDTTRAFEVFASMQKSGVTPNEVTYNSLINACVKADDTTRAFEVFASMQKSGVTPNEVTYTSLINGLYKAEHFNEIKESFSPKIMPVGAWPAYAEALRKLKKYPEAIELCDKVLEKRNENDELGNHAWIVKLYCLLHTNKEEFTNMHQSPPFDDKSPHYIRLLCARVFGSAVGEQDRNRYEKILETALGDKNNEAAKVDITQALKMLKRVTL